MFVSGNFFRQWDRGPFFLSEEAPFAWPPFSLGAITYELAALWAHACSVPNFSHHVILPYEYS